MLRCELTPLSLKDTAAYISGRIKTAGGEAVKIFTRDAVVAIHQHSAGIPRVISVICDNALVNGFAADQKPVGVSIVTEVCRSLSLSDISTAPVRASRDARLTRSGVRRRHRRAMFSQIGHAPPVSRSSEAVHR